MACSARFYETATTVTITSLAFIATPVCAEIMFDIEAVAADGMFNNRSSLEIDSDGVAHLAYMTQLGTDDASKEIVYATNADSDWVLTPVTEDTPVRNELPSLTLDTDGNVHIAWHQGVPAGSNQILYVNNVGNSDGSFNDIIEITEAGYITPSIRIDSADVVHFVFQTQTVGTTPEDVYYTTYSADEGVGDLVNISNTPTVLSWKQRIAIGPDDVVHLVYEDDATAFSGTLVYKNNATGDFEEVETTVPQPITNPAIVVSSANTVSIFYRLSDVLYVMDSRAGGQFSAPNSLYPDGVTGRAAFYERFIVGDDGRRHVAFASNVGDLEGIFYIGETENGWGEPIHIDGGSFGNQGTSIGLTPQGDVLVTYSLSGSADGVVFADLFAAAGAIEPPPCPGDLTDDGNVGVADLLELLSQWGACDDVDDCPGDLTGDGNVGVADLLELLGQWGACP